MKMKLHRLVLPLAHPFTIARGTITEQVSLVVELEHDGVRGFGEVTENSYYGHTYESMATALEAVHPHLSRWTNAAPGQWWPELLSLTNENYFATSAVDIAAHDLRGKLLGIPTWQDWGLRWENIPDSSYTIGIDSIETMLSKLAEQPGWSTYKIKLGTPHDIQIVQRLREATDAVFRVDANCGWTADETIANAAALAELGVEFIEQPLPPEAPDQDKLRVFAESALPIVADESCQQMRDVSNCAGRFHGVNVKVCKCGGLTPALHMLRQARAAGMKTMVGCMIESSIGISGAAQLLPLLDFADLDGAVLLVHDPASGVHIQRGHVRLAAGPGTGARLGTASES